MGEDKYRGELPELGWLCGDPFLKRYVGMEPAPRLHAISGKSVDPLASPCGVEGRVGKWNKGSEEGVVTLPPSQDRSTG